MSKVIAINDPEFRRKQAVAAIPRCETAMSLEGKKKVPDFLAYRKAKMLRDACIKALE